MTCKELIAIEYPEKLDSNCLAGVEGCPHKYGYTTEPKYCNGPVTNPSEEHCEACWDREVPNKVLFEKCTKGLPIPNHAIIRKNPKILDSGNRREFESGAVRDIQEGKGRCDLLPLDVVGDFLEDHILQHVYMFQKTNEDLHLFHALDEFIKNHEKWNMYTAILEVAKHFEEGCKKYGERNWEKGIPVRCYIDSAVRHYLKYRRGDEDEPHDRAFVWNILCAIWTYKHHPDLNEYAKNEEEK